VDGYELARRANPLKMRCTSRISSYQYRFGQASYPA
jgi:hypothetical protein